MATQQPTSNLKPKKTLFQRRIPTLLGLGVLLVALVSGMLFFSQGTGVFAPRATPQTTPKKIKITNITDSSFTISFFTDEATAAFIKYGTTADELKSQASDDRDQLSGSIGEYNVHHITVRGLEPNTPYFYTLGTGSGTQFDNNGTSFSTKTAARGGVPPAARTIYGSVVTPAGSPAEGTVVYATIDGVGELSSLVKSSGSWAIPLSTARTTDGSAYANITDESVITLLAQGSTANLTSQMTTTVTQAQPVATITLGESGNATAQTTTTEEPVASDSGETAFTDTGDNLENEASESATASDSATTAERGGLSDLLTETASDSAVSEATPGATLDLAKVAETPDEKPVIMTTQPVITATALPPNVVVTIQVNSETQINAQLTTDANGNFVLDIAKLSKELEPGEHSVTYSYVDPTTGQTVTKTQTFTVAADSAGRTDTSNQIAQVRPSPSPSPFGSGNPYPIGGATSSGQTATKSATTSTRVTVPSTSSGIPVSGSVGTTFTLVLGGLFFLIAGVWSYWIAQHIEEELA
jgi:hypothetical protein